ncbi:MAG: GNAT family N-acetyltransferase [Sphingobacteriia bacterium]|nr:GNAT family N-acetyltransferase [Sphingobacteriia bacterium]
MFQLVRTDSTNKNFIELVKLLDADLAIRDGDEHAFYAQFNKTNMLKHVLVGYENNIAVACGAIKSFNENSMEVKRMFVLPSHRNKGYASTILKGLEQWAKELGFHTCVLETGKNQPEAIQLYQKNSYHIIPNYGQYIGVENSICFEKKL